MVSYKDYNYGGKYTGFGITKCKWKPRKICAKRDWPLAFNDATIVNIGMLVSDTIDGYCEEIGESGPCKELNGLNHMSNKHDKSYEQVGYGGERRVSAVRCFPPGCGPDAGVVGAKDLKEDLDNQEIKHMLTCRSCGLNRRI